MKETILGCCFLWVMCVATAPVKHEYHGHKVFRVVPETQSELQVLQDFIDDRQRRFEAWREPTRVLEPLDVLVPPQEVASLIPTLDKSGLRHHQLIPDVQRLLERHDFLNDEASSGNVTQDIFNKYHLLDQIYNWLHEKAASCPPNLNCEILPIGKSFEGRDLLVFKIGRRGSGGERRGVWVDGGMHAREWISITTALYFIQQLTDPGSGSRSWLEAYDWYIMPVINPDGYQYTWTHDRLWRKTRSYNGTGTCVGVDANRNFPFKWNSVSGVLPNDPCMPTYAGRAPLTEPEVRAVSRFILRRRGTWELYLSLHSYSQLWMAPWGYTTQHPPHYQRLLEGGEVAIEALEAVHGTKFRTGSASKILYRSSGTSRDWAAGEARIPWVYTAELRDLGAYGFVLPPGLIRPVAEETWAGASALVDFIHRIEGGAGWRDRDPEWGLQGNTDSAESGNWQKTNGISDKAYRNTDTR